MFIENHFFDQTNLKAQGLMIDLIEIFNITPYTIQILYLHVYIIYWFFEVISR